MPVLIPFSEHDLPLSIIHENRISTEIRVNYTTIIVSVIIAFASLPFINISVSVRSNGDIISPEVSPQTEYNNASFRHFLEELRDRENVKEQWQNRYGHRG